MKTEFDNTENEALNKTDVIRSAEYKGYKIDQNNTGYVNYDFYLSDDCDAPIKGHGKTIEDCKKQIDDLCND